MTHPSPTPAPSFSSMHASVGHQEPGGAEEIEVGMLLMLCLGLASDVSIRACC